MLDPARRRVQPGANVERVPRLVVALLLAGEEIRRRRGANRQSERPAIHHLRDVERLLQSGILRRQTRLTERRLDRGRDTRRLEARERREDRALRHEVRQLARVLRDVVADLAVHELAQRRVGRARVAREVAPREHEPRTRIDALWSEQPVVRAVDNPPCGCSILMRPNVGEPRLQRARVRVREVNRVHLARSRHLRPVADDRPVAAEELAVALHRVRQRHRVERERLVDEPLLAGHLRDDGDFRVRVRRRFNGHAADLRARREVTRLRLSPRYAAPGRCVPV
jgi:hypothetical protein